MLGRIGVERRDAVQRDPAAGGVEARLGQRQRGRAVRDVAGEMRVRLRRRAEALDLLPRELRVGVRGREVAHQADDVRRRLRQLARAPSVPCRCRASGGPGCPSGISPLTEMTSSSRASRASASSSVGHITMIRASGQLPSQLDGLGDGDDAERRRAGLERRPPDVGRAVAVAVRLHDGPELGSVQRLEQPPCVVADRAEVDRDLAPVHGRPA